MRDLFKWSGYNAVMHGDKTSKMQWKCATHNLDCESVYDDSGNNYLIVSGTGFVIAVDGVTEISRRCTVWRDGLMGEIVANTSSISDALMEIRKHIPSHVIYSLQQKAGVYSGRRSQIS